MYCIIMSYQTTSATTAIYNHQLKTAAVGLSQKIENGLSASHLDSLATNDSGQQPILSRSQHHIVLYIFMVPFNMVKMLVGQEWCNFSPEHNIWHRMTQSRLPKGASSAVRVVWKSTHTHQPGVKKSLQTRTHLGNLGFQTFRTSHTLWPTLAVRFPSTASFIEGRANAKNWE